MNKFSLSLILLGVVWANSFSKIIPKKISFDTSILQVSEDSLEFSEPEKRLVSNFIIDLAFSKSKTVEGNNKVWVGNGIGVSSAEISPFEANQEFEWTTFTSSYKNEIPLVVLDSLRDADRQSAIDSLGIGGGSVAALAANDKFVWVSTASSAGDDLSRGEGLSFTEDDGKTWFHFPQPLDSLRKDDQPESLQGINLDEFRLTYEIIDGDTLIANPVTTDIQNLTFDIAIDDSAVWIASFAGGLRKSTDLGQSFERIIVPSDKMDSLVYNGETDDIDFYISPVDLISSGQQLLIGSLNYRGFSVAVGKDAIWYGSAGGINKSLDGKIGKEWARYSFLNSNLPGNWIISIGIQNLSGSETVWAGVMPTDISGEKSGIARSVDGGKTWETMLTNTGRVFNFAFDGDYVYAVSEFAVFVTKNGGNTWAELPRITSGGDQILTQEFYSAGFDEYTGIWIGSGDGLAITSDKTLNWKILRVFPPSNPQAENYDSDVPNVYAYPNPFSSTRDNNLDGDGHLRIHYFLENESKVSLKLFSFAMEHVISLVSNSTRSAGETDEIWNGKDKFGRLVANGVYFYRLEREGKKDFWGKIVIAN
ncbi:MAG: hypothetical protein DWQ06_12660 [Calditrichaeota bacterium]|nr:MAG: hypothetical protein DWQ06_12660 [Calditrichota bacterium]